MERLDFAPASVGSRDRRRGSIPTCRRRNRDGWGRGPAETDRGCRHGPHIDRDRSRCRTRIYPEASSRSTRLAMFTLLPGASFKLDAVRKSRGGTRWSTAFTVVSTIKDVLSPALRLTSVASVAIRSATISALGATRSYGTLSQAGKTQALHVWREEMQRIFERGEALAVAGDVQDRRGFVFATGALRHQCN